MTDFYWQAKRPTPHAFVASPTRVHESKYRSKHPRPTADRIAYAPCLHYATATSRSYSNVHVPYGIYQQFPVAPRPSPVLYTKLNRYIELRSKPRRSQRHYLSRSFGDDVNGHTQAVYLADQENDDLRSIESCIDIFNCALDDADVSRSQPRS